MKLGILTAPFSEAPLDEVANWAQSEGFEALEIACWPRTSGPSRRYAGTSHIDVASVSAGEGKEIVAKLNASVKKALSLPEVRKQLKGLGAQVIGDSPEEFRRFLIADKERWAAVITQGNIKPE